MTGARGIDKRGKLADPGPPGLRQCPDLFSFIELVVVAAIRANNALPSVCSTVYNVPILLDGLRPVDFVPDIGR